LKANAAEHDAQRRSLRPGSARRGDQVRAVMIRLILSSAFSMFSVLLA
jgi:hypothetical protein